MRLNFLLLRSAQTIAVMASLNVGAEKILYIGDSHSVGLHTDNNNFLGPKVFRALEADNHQVSFFASGGANVADYLWDTRKTAQPKGITKRETSRDSKGDLQFQKTLGNPPIQSLNKMLKDNEPHGVVINLGTNAMSLVNRGRTDQLKKDVDDMVSLIIKNNARCFWVLPPPLATKKMSLKNQKLLSETIESALAGRCTVFRSAEDLNIKPGSDGIHYGKDTSNKWAEALVPRLKDWIQAGRVRRPIDPPLNTCTNVLPVKPSKEALTNTIILYKIKY